VLSACAGEGNGAVARLPTCELLEPTAGLPGTIEESSGVAFGHADPAILWTHNDSGGEAQLYALGPAGELVGTVDVRGATNRDWEDLAAGPCEAGWCLYIGDIGDNLGARREVVIYRIPEPDPASGRTGRADAFPVRYPDGPRDAEALFATPDGALHVISKGRNSDIALYRYPPPLREGETVVLERVVTIAAGDAELGGQVTAAGASPDGSWVAVRTYASLSLYRAADLMAGRAAASIIDLAPLGEPQGEAVAVTNDLRVALTTEASGSRSGGSLTIIRCAVDSAASADTAEPPDTAQASDTAA
jgi:hypothetical protein